MTGNVCGRSLAGKWVRNASCASLVLMLAPAPCGAAPTASLTSGVDATRSVLVPGLHWSAPFALLLLAIALLPLVPVAHHWWEKNAFKLLVGLVLGGTVLAHYGLRGYGYQGHAPGRETVVAVIEHSILGDYVPFMVLLSSLYVIAGGLQLKGDLRAFPWVNTAFLALGALAASVVGTTGASMVLIRPLLQTNRERRYVRHTVVFFIFLVSNIGGCLLPTGDPPLFLGYLAGVPFHWTLGLYAPWLFSVVVLLAVYFAWDTLAYRRETAADIASDVSHVSPLRLHGGINVAWLLGAVLAVALIHPGRPLPGTDVYPVEFARESVLLGLLALSLLTTPRGLRRETEYSNAAIIEVACLFLGIFLTMQVPIEILQAKGAQLGLTTPAHFFWAAGSLSSVLDNAPTYVVFLEAAKSLPAAGSAALVPLTQGAVRSDLLAAVSIGAVFMGANTYIGNAPNLMVKLIAEQRRVAMPSFFGYMLYSGAILIPLFAVVTLLFFR